MAFSRRDPPLAVREVGFVIPGPPRAKGRPHAFVLGDKPKFYQDAKTRSYESLVRSRAADAFAAADRFDEPIAMRIEVTLEPARSESGVRQARMLAGAIRPVRIPDLDNVVKAVIDGCNGVAFRDDVLIVDLQASKIYGPAAQVAVIIRSLGVTR
jgi:Holliday junction resolvase RusA-like endonuclease